MTRWFRKWQQVESIGGLDDHLEETCPRLWRRETWQPKRPAASKRSVKLPKRRRKMRRLDLLEEL